MTQPDVARVLDELLAVGRRLGAGSSTLSRTAAYTLSTLNALGPLRLTDLAEREAVSQPAMTGLVNRLQGSGLVAREADPDDGRGVRVVLTDSGRRLVEQRRADYARTVATLVDRLGPDERSALTEALPALEALTTLAYDELPAGVPAPTSHPSTSKEHQPA